MKKFTKRFGLFMLVLVLGLCPILGLTACGENETNTNDGFEAVDLMTGLSKVNDLIKHYNTIGYSGDYDGGCDIYKIPSYKVNMSQTYKDNQNDQNSENIRYVTGYEIFTNSDNHIQVLQSLNADDGSYIEGVMYDESTNSYYRFEKDDDPLLKKKVNDLDEHVRDYCAFPAFICILNDSDYVYTYIGKKNNVYRVKLESTSYQFAYDPTPHIYHYDLVIDFDTTTNLILNVTFIDTYEYMENGVLKYSNVYSEYSFTYPADISLTIPQEILDAPVNE